MNNLLNQPPAFLTSLFFASLHREHIVHLAERTHNEAFVPAGARTRQHPDLPKLMAYEPKGMGYQLTRTIWPSFGPHEGGPVGLSLPLSRCSGFDLDL